MIEGIKPHMAVIGADGVHIGKVDSIEPHGVRLTRQEGGGHAGHHHFISAALIAGVEGDTVRLSSNADVAVTFEEEA